MEKDEAPIYKVLLDLQKQLGDMDVRVSRELGNQTATLGGLDQKATFTNGKIATAIADINNIKIELSDYPEVRKGALSVITWKRGVMMCISVILFMWGSLALAARYVADSYLDKHLSAILTPKNQAYELNQNK